MVDDQIRLLAFQQALEQESAGGTIYVGLSVSETIRICFLRGLSKKADKIRADWKVSDKR